MRTVEEGIKEDEEAIRDSEFWIKVPEALRRSWVRRRTLSRWGFTKGRTEGGFLHYSLGELGGH